MNGLIGNTPLIKINYKYNNEINYVYVKLEYYNLTGSIKDRMVAYIIEESYKNGTLKKGIPIIEATSGNTGIALAAIGAYYKNPVYIFMPDFVSEERKKIIELYGGKVITYSKEDGGFIKCIEEAKLLSEKLNGFLLNQFENKLNPEAHYNSTGLEILSKIKPDIFVSGIGTGGTLIGTGRRLKEENNTKIVAIEPDTSPILSGGSAGSHKIEGIGDDFIPEIVDLKLVDEVILINDDDAINMARKLAKELGLGVGISSGANFIGAVLSNKHNEVVTVFVDDLKKYLSTDLTKNVDNKEFISNKIELINYEII